VPNNYDSIAGYYDWIHHLFYGQAEVNAQVELLEHVRAGDRLMIVGGGTGWILEKIAAIHPSGLRITYIESSAKMMELTQSRNWAGNTVDFFTGRVENWRPSAPEGYDCILTGFFFDNFKAEHARRIVQQLTPYLKPGGYWLETDFYYPRKRGKLWQAILLWTMYVSARIICRVEARHLPDMETIFNEEGYERVTTAFHYQRFIRSMAYRKRIESPQRTGVVS